MNEEIHCFATKRKTAENEWKNDDPDFFLALCNVY